MAGVVLAVLAVFCFIFVGPQFLLDYLFDVNHGLAIAFCWIYGIIMVVLFGVCACWMLKSNFKDKYQKDLYKENLAKYSNIEPTDEEIEEFIVSRPCFTAPGECLKVEAAKHKYLNPKSIYYYKKDKFSRDKIINSWRVDKAMTLTSKMLNEK